MATPSQFIVLVDDSCAGVVMDISTAAFNKIENALLAIAEVAEASVIKPDPLDESPLALRIGDRVAFYRVDHLLRTVRLVGLE
jgi:hypothetical protein